MLSLCSPCFRIKTGIGYIVDYEQNSGLHVYLFTEAVFKKESIGRCRVSWHIGVARLSSVGVGPSSLPKTTLIKELHALVPMGDSFNEVGCYAHGQRGSRLIEI